MTKSGGTGAPNVSPEGEVRSTSQRGDPAPNVTPVGVCVWARPTAIVPVASVTMSGWMLKRWQIWPARAPSAPAKRRATRSATTKDTPHWSLTWVTISALATTIPAIERSKPPMRMRSVCPIAAMPARDARTRMSRPLDQVARPGSVTAPIAYATNTHRSWTSGKRAWSATVRRQIVELGAAGETDAALTCPPSCAMLLRQGRLQTEACRRTSPGASSD